MAIDVAIDQYCTECEQRLRAAPSSPDWDVVLGFDGYCDRIRKVLADRTSADTYATMDSMADLVDRFEQSVELKNSCSLEWTVTEMRAGGHTANVGRAYKNFGVSPTLVGTFGEGENTVFEEEFPEQQLRSLGRPSITDAIEFNDGKVMLNDVRSMSSLDWERVTEQVGMEELLTTIDDAALLSTGYWATIPALPSIWRGLREDIWPRLANPPGEILIDPADLRRLSTDQVRAGRQELERLNDVVSVTLSANHAETMRLAETLLTDEFGQLSDIAANLQRTLGVTNVLAHAESVSVLATPETVYQHAPPHIDTPEMTTGVGDCFNAGYLYARLLDSSSGGALLTANATANWFLREGAPPDKDALADFISSDRFA